MPCFCPVKVSSSSSCSPAKPEPVCVVDPSSMTDTSKGSLIVEGDTSFQRHPEFLFPGGPGTNPKLGPDNVVGPDLRGKKPVTKPRSILRKPAVFPPVNITQNEILPLDSPTSLSMSSSSSHLSISEGESSDEHTCHVPIAHIQPIFTSQPTTAEKSWQHKPKAVALDLFSGKGSVRQYLEKNGYRVISVDIDPRFSPTHISDIMRWNYRQYPPGFFKIIAASPPCTEYSRAKTIGWRRLEESDQLILRTLEIVEYFQPKLWWLENPRSSILTHRKCISGVPFIDVDYCQFSDWGYQKPTRIWGSENILSLGNKVCDGQTCTQLVEGLKGYPRHRERLGGRYMKFSTYQKWRVPEKLVQFLLGALDHAEEKFNFKREDYAVRNEFVHQIENYFGCKADKDCFASPKNSLCTNFFTKNDNALEREWLPGETLWINPPWSLWKKVANKLKSSKCNAICILPAWQRGWVKELIRMANKRIFFRPGTRLFEADGKAMGPIKWGVWALLIWRGEKPQVPPSSPSKIILKARMFKNASHRSGLKKFPKGERQLMVKTNAVLTNGEHYPLNVLVDTGAEVCLVKKGLFPSHLSHPAPKPLKFQTANGQPLEGGDRIISVKLQFLCDSNDLAEPETLEFNVDFFEANIQVDAILSFPWMSKARLGIFPHHKALVMDTPDLHFLYGVREHRKKCQNDLPDFSKASVCGISEMIFIPEKFGFHMPEVGFEQKVRFLKEDELEELASHLNDNDPPQKIHRTIIAREGVEHSEPTSTKVTELREKFLQEYEGTVFRDKVFPDPPPRGQYGYAYIPLKQGAVPTRAKPFFMHGERKEALEKITKDWIDMKFIEPATTENAEWLSQTFPVPKKSATFPWRGVVDMRGPNSQTRRVNYPLPKIEDILVKHGGNHIFSILDLKQAFHQQPLHPDSRPITCCFTPHGLYQWRVNVMGLTNASQQFQQMMDDILTPVNDVATGYIDDILIGTTETPGQDLLEDHARDLKRVMDVLQNQRLVVDPTKAHLFVKEVEFCGQILGHGFRRPAPGKLMAIEKWEVPTTITALRAFLGFTNYYNTYIHMYAQVAAPLQDLLKVPRDVGKKGSKKRVDFGPAELEAFHELKRRLISGLALQRVNPDKPFVLRVDASGYAVGATLEQLKEGDEKPTPQDVLDKKTIPVAFMSRKLAEGQRKWTPREMETYAIILALQKWESWIGLQPVLILTDHQSLESWAKEVLDTPSGPVGRRARWHQIFSKYDLTVGYIPGKENTIADILSRWAYPASQALKDISKHGSLQDKEDMEEIIRVEKEEELQCLWVKVKNQPNARNNFVRGITTRSGKKVEDGSDRSMRGTEEGRAPGGIDTTATPPPQGPRNPRQNHVSWRDDTNAVSGEIGPGKAPQRDEPDPSPTPATQTQTMSHEVEAHHQKVTDFGDGKSLWECQWGKFYLQCPTWKEKWEKTLSENEWPEGVKVLKGQMFLEEKLCIPLCLQNLVIQENHEFLGHVGYEKVWKHMALRYAWANEKEAQQFCQKCSKSCGVCQASSRGESLKGPIQPTPIPPAPMSSVAIDLFKMPHVRFEGGEYNMMAVCVDRHSGWLVAIPVMEKGLTGAKLARKMVQQHWRPFGIPSVISSDQGSHFVSTWWSTLCSLLGVRQAFSQAYHHQANGRVERAGQQLLEILRKLNTEQRINWVEALPQVVDRIHDVEGESGLSPYQILFGRNRPMAGIPYAPAKECEDALQFFNRMSEIDQKVAEVLNKIHGAQAQRINQGRKDMAPLKVGDKIWYKRPENSGEKIDSRWIGPGVVKAREGERSYIIEIKPGVEMKAHRSFLKIYNEPQVQGRGVPLYYHKRTENDEDAQPDEWEVEKIIAHRKKGNDWEFLTKWVGYADGEETWEPSKNFIHRISGEFLRYCLAKKLSLNWMQTLKGCLET